MVEIGGRGAETSFWVADTVELRYGAWSKKFSPKSGASTTREM